MYGKSPIKIFIKNSKITRKKARFDKMVKWKAEGAYGRKQSAKALIASKRSVNNAIARSPFLNSLKREKKTRTLLCKKPRMDQHHRMMEELSQHNCETVTTVTVNLSTFHETFRLVSFFPGILVPCLC